VELIKLNREVQVRGVFNLTVLAAIIYINAALTTVICKGDTFTNPVSGVVYHGYLTSQVQDGNTLVHTQEEGPLELNLARWDVISNSKGRNNEVMVLKLSGAIKYHIETEALIESIKSSADKGPLFIILEIDTPGGNIGLAKKLSSAISQTKNCEIIGYINGGEHGGAISAGAAIAFACDKIYMAGNSTIGAATAIITANRKPKDIKETYGEDVGEKFSSSWRAHLASLAEQNSRPGILARAMVDRDIEAIEVLDTDQKSIYIDPVNKLAGQKVLHTWSKKGSLLTLTSTEAVKCSVADKVVDSREELLKDIQAQYAKVIEDDSVEKASRELKRARLKATRLTKELDLSIKQLQSRNMPRPRALKLIRDIRNDFKQLLQLAKKYPDLKIDATAVQSQLNSVEAAYKNAKMSR
jgi:membrane-bound ClpP family serine protease